MNNFNIISASDQMKVMRGSRQLCQRGSNFHKVVFLADEGREDLKTTIRGPLLARQRSAI